MRKWLPDGLYGVVKNRCYGRRLLNPTTNGR